MPTYRYKCEKCGHEFEIFQSIKAAPLDECPEELCPHKPWGRGKVKRIPLGGAGLIFKGSGFYVTDYRSESYKEAVKKESESTKVASGGASEPKEKSSLSKNSNKGSL